MSEPTKPCECGKLMTVQVLLPRDLNMLSVRHIWWCDCGHSEELQPPAEEELALARWEAVNAEETI